MKRKPLSDNELAIMGVLWDAGRALSRPEILERLGDNDWNPNSIHMVLNNLTKKGFIDVAGVVPCGQNYGRAYAAIKSREAYAAQLVEDASPGVHRGKFVTGVICAMVRSDSVDEETIDNIEAMLKEVRRELQNKKG